MPEAGGDGGMTRREGATMRVGFERISSILGRVLLAVAEQATDRPFDVTASRRIDALRLKLEARST